MVLVLQFLEENQPDEGFLMWSVVVVLVSAGTQPLLILLFSHSLNFYLDFHIIFN